MKTIGKCCFCEGKIEQKEVEVRGKKIKLYICENNKQIYNENYEEWEESPESTCNWKLFSNNLLRYGKKSISEGEVRELLKNQEVKVRLYSKKLYNEETGKYGSEYFKYVIPDEEYGISVLFEE